MLSPLKRLAKDSFEYHELTGTDRKHQRTYAKPVTIEGVRVDKRTQYVTGADSKDILATHTIFTYKGVSTPYFQFKAESKVVYEGEEYIIVTINEYCDPYSDESITQEVLIK